MEQKINYKKIDWMLFWTAAGVVITLGSMIFGCFFSLKNDIISLDNRLNQTEIDINKKLSKLDKRIAVIETIMMLEGKKVKPDLTSNSSNIQE